MIKAIADAKRASANHLYWSSSRSVEELAERLGMSCHAVVSSVRPIAAGECGACGGEMAYESRSSRLEGRARCLDCGAGEDGPGERPVPRASGNGSGERPLDRFRRDFAAVPARRKALLSGVAALGVLVGVAAGEMARELG